MPLAMHAKRSLTILLAALALVAGSSADNFAIQALRPSQIKKTITRLEPLHRQLEEVQPGDWLASHEEKGQLFRQYVRIRPNMPTAARSRIYVQPIGEFSEAQQRLVQISGDYLKIYFRMDVKTLPTIDESRLPDSAMRTHPQWGDHQLLTSHILENELAPALPDDAFAMIAFTSSDLWPGDDWNFVFGYASYRKRVGVWSLYRFGDPSESDAAFARCLSRTLRLATHETGHMFSMLHCTAWQCNMQGSNSLEESDRQPLYLCPECHAKLTYATGKDPQQRMRDLIEFCGEHNLVEEANYYRKALEVLSE